MEPDDLLCSHNARPPKALVGRAQWKISQPPSLKRERASLAGSSLVTHCGLAWERSPSNATGVGWVRSLAFLSILPCTEIDRYVSRVSLT